MLRFYDVLILAAIAATRLGAAYGAEGAAEPARDADGWISLFNGKNLDGWKASERAGTFRVVDGELVVHGDRSHLFYAGPVGGADFKNFRFLCEVMTKPKANSGMFFHTKYQQEGWPTVGYEAQINNSHEDPKRTGGLYDVADVMHKSPAKDGEWFTQEVIVRGRRIVVKVDGKTTTDYTEPDRLERPPGRENRRLSHGTVAIQGHDPGSEVHYRKILIKILP
jgi:hypothetical protein